jgi:hypothetical protein
MRRSIALLMNAVIATGFMTPASASPPIGVLTNQDYARAQVPSTPGCAAWSPTPSPLGRWIGSGPACETSCTTSWTTSPRPGCEFMAAFGNRYPTRVMFDLLGIPPSQDERFVAWGKDLAHLLSYSVVEPHDRIEAALEGIYGATDRLCAERRVLELVDEPAFCPELSAFVGPLTLPIRFRAAPANTVIGRAWRT